MKAVFHVVIGLFFAVLMFVSVTRNNINLFMGDEEDFKKATIYFKQTTLDFEVDKFAKEKLSIAKNFKKITKEEAIKDFKSTFEDFSKNISELSNLSDLVPISYEVTFLSSEDRKKFINNESSNEIVDEIIAVDQIFSRYSSLQKSLNAFTFTLFGTSFLVCALLTSLLIRNIVYSEQKQIQVRSLYGESYHSIVIKYFKNLSVYFLMTVTISTVLVFLLYSFLKLKLHLSVDLRFISDRLSFMSVFQFVSLVTSFAVAYFGGLYFVLKQSVLKSFQA